MYSPKHEKKTTKRSFRFLHSTLIVFKYILKIAKVVKSIFELFR